MARIAVSAGAQSAGGLGWECHSPDPNQYGAEEQQHQAVPPETSTAGGRAVIPWHVASWTRSTRRVLSPRLVAGIYFFSPRLLV